MKLIIAIVQDEDASRLVSRLMDEGFGATKLATTGGFLMSGNTTFLIGVNDDQVNEVIETIAKHSKKRKQMIPSNNSFDVGMYSAFPVEVTVGGATVFVLDVESMDKY